MNRTTRWLTALSCAAGLGLSTQVAAVPLMAEASYTINGVTTNEPTQTSDTNVDILRFTGSDGVSIGIHTFGSLTRFGNRVSGNINGTGDYNVFGEFTLTLENFAGGDFDFNITPGEVRADGFFTGTDFTDAQFMFEITVNGSTEFAVDIMARSDNSGQTSSAVSSTGHDIASCSGNACSIQGGAQSLTNLAPGTLIYTLTATASGAVSQPGLCGFGGGEGEGGGREIDGDFPNDLVDLAEGRTSGMVCGSIARSGDPLPEPATLALGGLGLLAVAMVRRRRLFS